MKRKLTVEPIGGLCNRMRVIASAIALADQMDLSVHIIWPCNRVLNCTFESLFEVPDEVHTITHMKQSPRMTTLFRLLTYCVYVVKGSKSAYIGERFLKQYGESLMDYHSVCSANEIYIATCHSFGGPSLNINVLRPVNEIKTISDEITATFGSHCVGVHFRGTDHIIAKEISTLDKFIDAMRREINIYGSESSFFLATDEAIIERRLKDLFGDRIITYKKRSLDRNCPLAIQDALVDLICLSHTKRVLGTYWSSFSETAASLGGISLEIVK